MQIFIPLARLLENPRILDTVRLNKQILEAFTLIQIIQGTSGKQGWHRHLATLMWAPYVDALKAYKNACVAELAKRATKSGKPRKMDAPAYQPETVPSDFVMPHFMGNELIHSSHRANLLRKALESRARGKPQFNVYDWYSQFHWTDEPRDGYVWDVGGKLILVENLPAPSNPNRKISKRYSVDPVTHERTEIVADKKGKKRTHASTSQPEADASRKRQKLK